MIDSAQYIDGRVMLRYYQPVPKQINVGGKIYVTDVRHGIAIILVDESEAPALLAHLGGCCGGKRHVFSLASELAKKVWLEGNY